MDADELCHLTKHWQSGSALLRGADSLKERRMFGGLTFMVSGRMCGGIAGDNLVVRTGPKEYDEALSQPQGGP